MRLCTLATTTFLLAFTSAQDAYNPQSAETSVITTWTLTRTVKRVVETVTATRSNSTTAVPLTTATGIVMPYGNGTTSVLGTAAGPSGSGATQAPMDPPASGGERVGIEALRLVAVVGLVGLAGL